MSLINVKGIKDYCKPHNRRVGKAFLDRLELLVREKVDKAIGTHDGGRVTLGESVANWIGLPADQKSLEDNGDIT